FPEYLPPREGQESFQKAVAAAKKRDVNALVYMNQRLWGMTTRSWKEQGAERFAVKGMDGRVQPENYNTFMQTPCASMCMGTEFWRKTYADLAVRAVRDLGAGGIYMDQACTSLACYDPSHGHPIGGGTYWVRGFQTMAQDIRSILAQQRRTAPPALAGEGCGESWLPHLDLMLSLQVSKERYSAPDGWEPIPFFHAVYHAYGIIYGNYSSLTMPPYDELWPAESAPKEPLQLLDRKFSRQFYLEQARAFVWGQQPTVANFLPEHLQARPEETAYVLRLATLRSKAEPFLQRGTFLRAPDLHVPSKTLDMSRLSIYAGQQGGLKSFQQDYPLALAGAWKAPNREVAFALTSIADEPLEVELEINLAYYGLPEGRKIYQVDERSRRQVGVLTGTKALLKLRLPARGACLLECGKSR
ncbi:MAG TPA: DUF6259 domain-containing protein, partial [Clostridia bacterium]|nr:DUF6259 domain-containing protein [Clostridia bacterium]